MTSGDREIRFGFRCERGGAHTARTMMLRELTALLAYVPDSDAGRADYRAAIEQANCLGKRSVKTRGLTSRHLIDLYALDPGITLFRALRFFWSRDPAGRPLLALLCASARDAVLRDTAAFIMAIEPGATVTRDSLEAFIDNRSPNRFSPATLKSTAQNINSTWTQSGHLSGRVHKVRTRATPTPGSVSYALLLGCLNGVRGERLFATDYARLLDCSVERAIELAGESSRRGWIVFKHIGDVVEVSFPNLITLEAMEWLREPD